jgi:hypothetical protein
MLPQGVLGFQYEADRSSGGLTSLAGLPLYLDLIEAIGLSWNIGSAIRASSGSSRNGYGPGSSKTRW